MRLGPTPRIPPLIRLFLHAKHIICTRATTCCRRSHAELLSLRQRLSELEYSHSVSEGARGRLETQLRELEGFLRDARKWVY